MFNAQVASKTSMMKKLVVLISIALIASSCGTYRHYAPTPNAEMFQEAGEVHFTGEIGISGASTKGAVSLTDHVAVIGQYAGGFTKYRSRDYEFGAGFYWGEGTTCDFISAGLGWGNNWGFEDTTYTTQSYMGHYMKPFVQITTGKTGAKLFWKVKGDLAVGMKMSYFMYDGHYLTTGEEKIRSNYTLTEPFFMWGIGGRVTQFQVIWGMPMHLTLEPLDSHGQARTYPMNLSFGLRFVIGRPKSE